MDALNTRADFFQQNFFLLQDKELIVLTQELSAASTVDPRYGSLDRHPPSRYDQALWFKFNFFPFSCETQSSLSSLAPCQTLPRYAASLI